MDQFSVNFTQQELSVMRQSLDVINLQGKDAKFIAMLQIKLESELEQIAKIIQSQQVVEEPYSRTSNKKKTAPSAE